MSVDAALGLVIAAVVVSAMAAAASLDQSIKQLPTRRRIGALAYSGYSLVADARNGLFWYVPLVIAWIPITVAAAVVGWADHPNDQRAIALATTVVGVAAHILVTGVFAAPTLVSQRAAAGDERALERVFDRFERWQTIRAVIDVATLGASVWALVATIASR
jgi:hypothetical protein